MLWFWEGGPGVQPTIEPAHTCSGSGKGGHHRYTAAANICCGFGWGRGVLGPTHPFTHTRAHTHARTHRASVKICFGSAGGSRVPAPSHSDRTPELSRVLHESQWVLLTKTFEPNVVFSVYKLSHSSQRTKVNRAEDHSGRETVTLNKGPIWTETPLKVRLAVSLWLLLFQVTGVICFLLKRNFFWWYIFKRYPNHQHTQTHTRTHAIRTLVFPQCSWVDTTSETTLISSSPLERPSLWLHRRSFRFSLPTAQYTAQRGQRGKYCCALGHA